MKKRVFPSKLKGNDVRIIEMHVDGICVTEPAYVLQFWRDAYTYGMDEAFLYLGLKFPDYVRTISDMRKYISIRYA